MTMTNRELLYSLLPAHYRLTDAERGETLRGLMGVLDEIRQKLHADIGKLHDNWFIETCEEWAIPYIADLLGVEMHHSIASAGIFNQRPFVGRTIHYRRRKGTVTVLENIARDVSGWPVKAVEFFQHLTWSQHLNHLRMELALNPYPAGSLRLNPSAIHRVGTANIRDIDGCERIGGAFNTVSHSFDMRPLGQLSGHFGIDHIGLFTWRINAQPLRAMTPRRSQSYADGFMFDPAGARRKLYTNPRSQLDPDAPRDEHSVPAPVRPAAFWSAPEAYYGSGPDAACAIYESGTRVDQSRILCKNLSAWSPPPSGMIAIDPVRGRFAYAPGESAEFLTVDYTWGFGLSIGGGPYDRRESVVSVLSTDYAVTIAADGSGDFSSLAAAIAGWDQTAHARAVLTILDNATYREALNVSLSADVKLVLQARNRARPHVQLIDDAGDPGVLRIIGGAGARAVIECDGLYVEGAISIDADSLKKLTLRHCTMIPGRAVLETGIAAHPAEPSIAFAHDSVEHAVTIHRSICGPLIMEENGGSITVTESILDHPARQSVIAGVADDSAPGPDVSIQTSTVVGEIRARQITLASDTLFVHRIMVKRKQLGCMRYCYIDEIESVTPRRFKCQPENTILQMRKRPGGLAAERESLMRIRTHPVFTSERFGNAGYCQLALPLAPSLAEGAEDRNEIGVFNIQKQAFRAYNIEQRTNEYCPVRMKPGIIYAT